MGERQIQLIEIPGEFLGRSFSAEKVESSSTCVIWKFRWSGERSSC
jgi:hypothetical protein